MAEEAAPPVPDGGEEEGGGKGGISSTPSPLAAPVSLPSTPATADLDSTTADLDPATADLDPTQTADLDPTSADLNPTTADFDPTHPMYVHCKPSDLSTTQQRNSSGLARPQCDWRIQAVGKCEVSGLAGAGSGGCGGDGGCHLQDLQKADSSAQGEKLCPSPIARQVASDQDRGDNLTEAVSGMDRGDNLRQVVSDRDRGDGASERCVHGTGLSHPELVRPDSSRDQRSALDNRDKAHISPAHMSTVSQGPRDKTPDTAREGGSREGSSREGGSLDTTRVGGFSDTAMEGGCREGGTPDTAMEGGCREGGTPDTTREGGSREGGSPDTAMEGGSREGGTPDTTREGGSREGGSSDTTREGGSPDTRPEDASQGDNGQEAACTDTDADAGLGDQVVRLSNTGRDGDLEAEDREQTEEEDKSQEDKDEEDANPNPWPRHRWRALPDLRARETGSPGCTPPSVFREKVQGSLYMVQRLKLQHRMEHHEGCVNSLHFNRIGTLLASGADDLQIVLWNWARNRKALVYDSGHRSNVFQAKFMPYSGDCHVVTCARDGQVRLSELSLTGVCKSTTKLAQHRGAAHKLALEYDSPHVFLSCGEDALTYQIDLREEKPKKLVVTKENDTKVPLYSIHSNPVNPYQFLTSGRDPYIRIYDKRKINENVNGGIVKKYCPKHLDNSSLKTNVTCACYSYNGSEIVGSYNDEDIYVFDNLYSDGTDALYRYSGHRNNATVKGVSFYGPRSEYVVTGSDCGHIFLWDKVTQHVVQFLDADHSGVVNSLEAHPFAPVLATSGLDHDVKIWAPVSHDPPRLQGLEMQARKNRRERQADQERTQEPEMIDGQMLWVIMNHFRRSARRRLREGGEEVSSSSNSSDSDDDDDDDDDDDHEGPADSMQCHTS
ncbi:uncharacterized protein LOC143291451 [Babylonia areolata]|uniref:uncharacterized protein LOC143291451 n=1 Tax=Babylonia areolata TaxID=304850 RepID=UPI003FD4A959